MPIRLEFNLGVDTLVTPGQRDADRPMRLLLLGDFGGPGNNEPGPWPKRPVPAVDIDNFESIINRIAPRLQLPSSIAGEPALQIEFGSLDDFHPDALFQRLPHLQPLRELRRRLVDDRQAEAAIVDMRAAGLLATTAAATAAPMAARQAESDGDAIARLLGRPAMASASTTAFDAMVARIVAPHIVSGPTPLRAEALAVLDSLAEAHLRHVLHAPAFRALEAAWRGLHWLITQLELDETLQLHLFDISREALRTDLAAAGGELSKSALLRRLRETGADAPDGEPWSMVVGLFDFGASDEDLTLLAALGALSAAAGGPFVASASPAFCGCTSPRLWPEPARWAALDTEPAAAQAALRRSPVAPWIGLAAPRLLLRLPYGAATDPIDSLAFEEQPPGPPDHETLAWGSGALAVAWLVGRAFRDGGWNAVPGGGADVTDLPAFVYEHEGEKQLQPCAEAAIGEAAGEAMLARGLIPLLSHRHRAAVRVLRIQSIAEPAQALRFG